MFEFRPVTEFRILSEDLKKSENVNWSQDFSAFIISNQPVTFKNLLLIRLCVNHFPVTFLTRKLKVVTCFYSLKMEL